MNNIKDSICRVLGNGTLNNLLEFWIIGPQLADFSPDSYSSLVKCCLRIIYVNGHNPIIRFIKIISPSLNVNMCTYILNKIYSFKYFYTHLIIQI